MFITVNRIMETGAKTQVDLVIGHIVCVSNYFRPGIDDKIREKLQEETCVVMLSNGVVMHIEMNRNGLKVLL